MSYEIIVRSNAERHISLAYKWYEEQVKGLGDEFLLSIDASLNLISRTPFLFQKKIRKLELFSPTVSLLAYTILLMIKKLSYSPFFI